MEKSIALKQARAALRGMGKRGRTTRIPDEVRGSVQAYVAEARSSGAAWAAIAAQVGLSLNSLRRWEAQAAPAAARTVRARLRPVALVAEKVSAAAGRLTLTTVQGDRLEGLSLDEASQLLRALR